MATTAARRAAWQTRVLLGVTWLGILVASDLPAIIIGSGFAVNPQVYRLVTALILLALLALTASVSWLVALRGAVLALVALTIGQLARQLIEITPWWTSTVGRLPADVQILADSLVGFIPAALMVGASLWEGLDRGDIYLAWGDLRASSSIGWRGHNLRWTTLGPILAVLFSVGLVVQLLLTVRPDASLVGRLAGAIPLALLFALVNPVAEEVRYRCVLLARLEPAIGGAMAMLATSALFGLAHWSGHPSGPTGVFLAGLAGWFWALSIRETRGIGWAWITHGIQDFIILLVVALAP